MLHLFARTGRARPEYPPAPPDPLASLTAILDQAHRELDARDLAAVLVELDWLAAALTAGSTDHPPAQCPLRPTPGTPAGQVYRTRAALRLRECLAGPARQAGPIEVDRLRTYIAEVATRPARCAISS